MNGTFFIEVSVNGGKLGTGCAKTKKQAEQLSAYEALVQLREL
jgi:dsRNA-specific ribonuclease